MMMKIIFIVLITLFAGCIDESPSSTSTPIPTSTPTPKLTPTPTPTPIPIKEYSEFSTAAEYVRWIIELDKNDAMTDYQKENLINTKIIGKYIQWECLVEDVYVGSSWKTITLTCYADSPPKALRFRSVFLDDYEDDFENVNSDMLLSINKGDTLKFGGKVRSEFLGALYLKEWKISGITS